MNDDDRKSDNGAAIQAGTDSGAITPATDWLVRLTGQFIHLAEVGAAALFAVLFAIGVVDLFRKIVKATISGKITDPLVVIGFVDVGLLLLIIIEVYHTVVAYMEGNETRDVVRLVIYTGVIALVRKAIIFRTGEYATAQDAMFAAIGYTVIIFGLVGLLLVERVYDRG